MYCCLIHALCSVKCYLMEWLYDGDGVPKLGKDIVVTGCQLRDVDDTRWDEVEGGEEAWCELLRLVNDYEMGAHSDYPLKTTRTYLPLEKLGGDIEKIVDAITPGCLGELEKKIAAHKPSRSNSVGSENSEGIDIAKGASPPTGRMQRHVCSPQKDNETPAQHIARYKEKLDLTRCAANLG